VAYHGRLHETIATNKPFVSIFGVAG
jgi:hypothetical protein